MLDRETLVALPVLWAPVPGWEGLYDVSSHGQVRSLDRFGHPGRTLKPRHGKYQYVTLSGDGLRFDYGIHRLMAQAFLPNPDDAPLVRHDDGDAQHNNIHNFSWGSHADNVADAQRHGTRPTKKVKP